MLLLNSLLAARSCVIKRFVLPEALLRNFPPEGSLSHPPNLRRLRIDTAAFTASFITVSPGGALTHFIFNLVSRQELIYTPLYSRLSAGYIQYVGLDFILYIIYLCEVDFL